ncbi:MAG: ABC transporter ATP-binding protein [Candidatus Thermoplasmatota archaeon]|nr:ABC transporter ATP-binding protein [Euryarchaeota archaeon]MBU4031353.1 ABC transporter ATP-binding protein [Candidatus Thermoplasmatota archaeon]MBU4070834.1 ABC transporter ATP-binding protein [Candidatus Thermoplasmatota archaeon]MBU4143517.1 ABC transporter ATP-binding protein [Candidatus Thermoplasmatota archaeon]MBU4591971.1 ABC transporter ATP-binding protein [Candidatus Thermoplasmatota archaeon]
MHAIKVEKLEKKFGDFRALDGLDLDIRKGEVYGLLGPNGAGKTTAIKVLTGLLKMTAGNAEVLGTRLPNKDITQRVGYMPQETALYLGLTVHQNLEFFGKLFGMDKSKILEREAELLKFIDLERWKDEMVTNLSGGMKHRVSLACALIHEPEVLFLDEPTVGVDPELRESFWKFFGNLKEKGITILITTHYMDEASHCDRIGFMRTGKLIAEGQPQAILREAGTKSLEDAFLFFARRGK